MKSAKQNTIRQSIDRHRITLIESKQRLTTKYYSLVLNRERAMQTTAIKRMDLERHRGGGGGGGGDSSVVRAPDS